MTDEQLIERLEAIIEFLNNGDRETADAELYSLFDEMEFISEDYDDDEDMEEDEEDYNEEEDE